MDIHELFLSCRRGDIGTVEYLVEEKDVDLNVRDKWDSTPLYYACLCGHKDLVRFLLDKGAKCGANTFDGERCIYGAHTDEIRHLLKSYKVLNAQTQRRDLYKEFLRTLLDRGMHHDIVFHIHGVVFPAHKCILSARSPYFAEQFKLKWKDKKEIHLGHKKLFAWAFQPVLQYIYTGVLEADLSIREDVVMVARQLQLDNLVGRIESHYKEMGYFARHKPGMTLDQVMQIEPNESDYGDIYRDLGNLAEIGFPAGVSPSWISNVLPFVLTEMQTFPDVCVVVEGHFFDCHQAFLCGRSDYLKAVLKDHFDENTHSNQYLPTVTLCDIDVYIWTQILLYIYQDSCELNVENVFDILCTADLYLLPGLKRQCAIAIVKFLDTENVVEILQTSRLFRLPKLEDACKQFMADNLEEVIAKENFIALVKQDAAAIKDREELDTCDVIDDVRLCITMDVQNFSDITTVERKLALIDGLLEDLGIGLSEKQSAA